MSKKTAMKIKLQEIWCLFPFRGFRFDWIKLINVDISIVDGEGHNIRLCVAFDFVAKIRVYFRTFKTDWEKSQLSHDFCGWLMKLWLFWDFYYFVTRTSCAKRHASRIFSLLSYFLIVSLWQLDVVWLHYMWCSQHSAESN